MKDYVSQILDSFKSKNENVKKKESKPKSESLRKSLKSEDTRSNKQAIHEILGNLKQLRQDFEEKILIPAKNLDMNPDNSFIKGGDKSNPHLRAIYRLEEAMDFLKDQLKMQLMDPIKDEEGRDDVGADAPLNNSELPSTSSPAPSEPQQNLEEPTLESRVRKIEESYRYYQGMHPEIKDELLQINGWTYSGNEIWDNSGICSIVYEPDEDKIFVFELLDENGVDQDLIATCDSVDELDDALTNFVELDEIAPEMKEAFAQYVENQRSHQNEAIEDLDFAANTIEDDVEFQEPIIIDEWEYQANDPEYNGNPTLLYDKGGFVVFLQKDADPENEMPYLAMTAGFNNGDQSHQEATIDALCKWLEVNEYPVPTEDAKIAFSGESFQNPDEMIGESKEDKKDKEEQKDFVKKLPDGMKRVKDDPSTTTLAKVMDDPKVAKIEEPKK